MNAEPRCTCIEAPPGAPIVNTGTAAFYCPVHMPAPKTPPFGTAAGAGNPGYGHVVTMTPCSRCGALGTLGFCSFCAERDKQQASLCDVAKRARESERVKTEEEIAEWLGPILGVWAADHVRRGAYRKPEGGR